MKYSFITFLATAFLFAGCTKNSLSKHLTVSGKILSEVTNQVIPNAKVFIEVVSVQGTGLFSYEKLLDSFSIITDNDGKFSSVISYTNEPNISVKFYKEDDAYSTLFVPQKTQYSLSDLLNDPVKIFYVRKYANLKINVKNIHPFNDSDAIGLYIIQTGTNYFNRIIDSIQNFGVVNQPFTYGVADDDSNPYWIGMAVTSTIFGKLQEATSYQIRYNVRRNGTNNDYYSPKFTTTLNVVNSYDLFY